MITHMLVDDMQPLDRLLALDKGAAWPDMNPFLRQVGSAAGHTLPFLYCRASTHGHPYLCRQVCISCALCSSWARRLLGVRRMGYRRR